MLCAPFRFVPTNSKSISSFTSDNRMNAVTTPLPRLVFICAVTLPYHTYVVLASSVPTDFSGMVSSTWSPLLSLYFLGSPLYTQSALDASPRYSALDCMPSSEVSL